MITISVKELFAYFLAFCVGFTTICVAGGHLIKLIRAAKKPSDDMKEMLKNDDKRLKSLEETVSFLAKAISLLLQDDLEILKHLQTTNNTGAMAAQEKKVTEFLTETKMEVKV